MNPQCIDMTAKIPDEPQDIASRSSASWDVAADWWKTRTDGNDPYRQFVHGPALLSACGDVKGLNILDVGCGAGYFSRLLSQEGGSVVALDYSANLVHLAEEEEKKSPLGIKYEQLDAAELSNRFENETFDLVTGCMSIADIRELDAALEGIRNVRRPGGKFCFSLPHPIASPPENRWLSEESTGGSGRVLHRYFGRRRVSSGLNRISGKPDGPELELWHMPISDWLELLASYGITVDQLTEPRPTREMVKKHPALKRISEIPEFLVISGTRFPVIG